MLQIRVYCHSQTRQMMNQVQSPSRNSSQEQKIGAETRLQCTSKGPVPGDKLPTAKVCICNSLFLTNGFLQSEKLNEEYVI